MNREINSLPRRVFNAVTNRLTIKAGDIALFAATQDSFEEWLNWEAFLGCWGVCGWQTRPKPRYCELGAKDCQHSGDLLVTEGDDKLLVEIGLVHDGTGDKWRDKLDRDAQKSARVLSGISWLHIVVLVSAGNIQASDRWQRWLSKLPCWNRPYAIEASTLLPPRGQMITRGWTGICDGSFTASSFRDAQPAATSPSPNVGL